MNRSQRRAAVIKRSIAAGLLCAGVGAGAVAPAVADAGDDTGGAVASNNRGLGRGGPAAVAGISESVGSTTRRGTRIQPRTDDEWHPHPYWCEIVWPQWPIDPPLPYTGNRNGIIAPFLPTQTAAVAVAGGIVDGGVHASTGLESAPETPPMAVPPAAPAAPAASPAGPAAVAAAALPAAPPPAAGPPPVSLPESVAPAPNRVPPRLPDLPSANLAEIAAVALPGLAGIAALTALGGFLGYRQAKAGYVLRAAGTARFLQ